MTVLEFTCGECGSFEVIPLQDLRQHLGRKPPFRCPECGGSVSVDVLNDFDPSDDAWFSARKGIGLGGRTRRSPG